jgi:hypothetical protein
VWKIEKIVRKGDYFYAVVKDHPNSSKFGYVLEHRVVMENHLGRLLDPKEHVHHVNGDRHDNRVENLLVMTEKEHLLEHNKSRSRLFLLVKCPECRSVFDRDNRNKKPIMFCSRKCAGLFSMRKRLLGITTEMESAVSGNILAEFRKKWTEDNPEEMSTSRSVETIRTPPEKVMI